MQIEIYDCQLEPGRHIARNFTSRKLAETVEIPDAECKEVRADWGEYLPVTTFTAIERALRARGKLPHRGPDACWSIGIKKETIDALIAERKG